MSNAVGLRHSSPTSRGSDCGHLRRVSVLQRVVICVNKSETSFGAHVLDFIDIKAIEVHNNFEYLTI